MCAVTIGCASAAHAVTTIKCSTFKGMRAVDIENQSIKVRVLPNRGANIISIIDKRNGRDWAWQNPEVPYQKVKYGSNYMLYDASGFDDSFSTIGKGLYPYDPWKDIQMPDHGELWTQPATYTISRDKVRFKIQGIRLPYIFEKEISLPQTGVVKINYKITNPAPVAIRGFWTAHYLVQVSPGMEMFLPGNATILKGMDTWPVNRSNGFQWIRIGSPETRTAIKRFTDRLTEGCGGFYDPKTSDFIAYIFSHKELPYCGVFINQKGNPEGALCYNAGLEPTSGDEDYIRTSAKGVMPTIAGSSCKKWQMNIVLGTAKKADMRHRMNEAQKRIGLK